MNTLDFEFSHYENDDYTFSCRFLVTGPSADEFFEWEGLSDVQEEAEGKFGATLDSVGGGTEDGDVELAFCSAEVADDEMAEKIVAFIVEETEKATPLLNWRNVYAWGAAAGIKKMMPPEQLHATLATVREPCDWDGLELHTDTISVPAGHKTLQIFGWDIKALAFGHPAFKARHEQLLDLYPQMDHPLLRPHVTLYRGGKLITEGYTGELVLGPEVAQEFDAEAGKAIKHVKIAEML